MGVADNKTYKNMYHFNDKFFRRGTSEDMPSLNVDPDINHTIKENPFRANVEIEKDEIILQPDLSALFKAKGKTHKQGGIDVMLRPDSFVFSDDKSLALTPEECEMFELKKGGKVHKPEDYTPAHTVKRNVDPKHYNRLISNTLDPKKDDLAIKSSIMMLSKYINTLGGIAYLQEAKKDFPDGIPAFAMDSAPVFDPELDDTMDEQKQYAKYGGTINPYKDKLQLGGFAQIARMQKELEDCRRRGDCPPAIAPTTTKQSTYRKKPRRVVAPTMDPFIKQDLQRPIPIETGDPKDFTIGELPTAPNLDPILQPKQVEGEQQLGKAVDWNFTPWQKLSQGYNLAKFAGLKRYMPYRSRFDATYMDPALVNPEQAIGDARSLANQQLKATSVLNPILRNAQASSAYGELLDKIPALRSQYDNQNAGITNQARQFNTQIRNQETMTNMTNDQNYYREATVARQNFDNMRTYMGDQYMNNLLRDVETNQTLAYNLLTRNNPAYGFDFRSGNFYRNDKHILDVQGAAGTDAYERLLKGVENLSDSDPKKWEIMEKIYRQKNIIPYLQQPQRKGGRINPWKTKK